MDSILLAGVGAGILVGLVGTVAPRLPGVGLIWGAILVWTSIENTSAAWAVLGVATVLAVANHLAQHMFAGRRLSEAVAPMRSVAIAAALGAVGFALARALGLMAGFALGLYLAERHRLRDKDAPRPARHQRPLVGRESAAELVAGLLVTAAWLVAVVG